MHEYKCPGCGSTIQQTDMYVSTDSSGDDFIENIHRISFDTSIKHLGSLVEEPCAEFMMGFAQEIQTTMNALVEKFVNPVPGG